MKLFSTRNPERSQYLSWDDYAERMAVLELHAWQQATRKRSMRNAATSDL